MNPGYSLSTFNFQLMPLPIVAIVGRPNVGKSTLFNRIIKKHLAVVDPSPGVTRDRNYTEAEWAGVRFTLVDTGGYILPGDGDELADAVREQTLIAANEADIVLLVLDAQAGATEVESELGRIIQRRKAEAILVVNKVDDQSKIALAWEQPNMGLGDPFPVSAQTGFQVAELLDELTERIRRRQPNAPPPGEGEILALAIIGAPNSGKSSLVNRLVGKERMVVSDIPGTTRDSIDTIIQYHGDSVRLVDTAGLRRKRYGVQGIEFYTTLRALRALERCQVAVIMIDAARGLTQGDIKLAQTAADAGVGLLICANKWDAVERDQGRADKWMENWKSLATQLTWAPMLFVSALTGRKAISVIEEALVVKAEREKRVVTSELNEKIVPLIRRTPPPAVKGKFIRIKYGAQVESAPPKFAFFASHANLVPENYRRYVERLIREEYHYRGVPIKVEFRFK